MRPLLLLLCGCGAASRGLAPEAPLDADERIGQLAFDRHCQACHPDGEAGVGPALARRALPGFLVRVQVRRGFGAMPAFPEHALPEADLDGIVGYLEALRAAPAAHRVAR